MSARNSGVHDTEPLDEVLSPDFDDAIARLSHLGRAVAAYVEDVRRNLLVAVHEPVDPAQATRLDVKGLN